MRLEANRNFLSLGTSAVVEIGLVVVCYVEIGQAVVADFGSRTGLRHHYYI